MASVVVHRAAFVGPCPQEQPFQHLRTARYSQTVATGLCGSSKDAGASSHEQCNACRGGNRGVHRQHATVPVLHPHKVIEMFSRHQSGRPGASKLQAPTAAEGNLQGREMGCYRLDRLLQLVGLRYTARFELLIGPAQFQHGPSCNVSKNAASLLIWTATAAVGTATEQLPADTAPAGSAFAGTGEATAALVAKRLFP